MTTELWIKRDNIREFKFVDNVKSDDLQPNQVLLQLAEVGFTANNITYAVTGDRFNYWNFFPTNVEGWGKLPVWGFADVVESQHPDIQVGERIYGYFPLATHLTVLAGKVSTRGFDDISSHRKDLSAVYNRYVRTANSAGFDPQHNALNALLRPMFTTSFLLDDFIGEKDAFDAHQIILSSASSKTAYSMAFLLNSNREHRAEYTIVGLTSFANTAFVNNLGCYDKVLAYEDVVNLSAQEGVIYLDFAGNSKLSHQIHDHFGENLRHHATIGVTHWDQSGSNNKLAGVRPELFFAPAYLKNRLEIWGGAVYEERYTAAWSAFLMQAPAWMEIEYFHGKDAIGKVYKAMLEGHASPNIGHMLAF